MSKRLIAVIVCLIIMLLFSRRENRGLEDAQAMLVAKMLENERLVQVFSLEDEVIST